MRDDLIIFLVNAYKAYDRAVDSMLENLERRLRPALDVLGAVIMAMPLIGFLLWLLGHTE